MLRAALQTSRALGNGSIVTRAGRQWLGVRARGASAAPMRTFAELISSDPNDSKSAVAPTSTSATAKPAPAGPVPTSTASTVPPSTTIGTSPTPPPASTSPPPPPPPPPPPAKKPRRLFLRLLLTLVVLTVVGFGGGVYYSRVSDNFHDFFTEYIPFGEQAVLYFEDRDFRKKFPLRRGRPARDTGGQVTIPSQSGLSWKVSEDEKEAKKSIKSDASKTTAPPTPAVPTEVEARQVQKVENVKKDTTPAVVKTLDSQVISSPAKPVEVTASPKTSAIPATPESPKPSELPVAPKEVSKPPEVDEPSRFLTSVTPIDPINMKDANDPLVQDLAKILNDIITVVNADNANERFTATIGKAKSELEKFGGKIKALKDAAVKEADEKVKASHTEFDNAAVELVRRLDRELSEHEARMKDEFEQDRQKLQESYDKKVTAETERLTKLHDQVLQNELVKQAVDMKRKFIQEVKDRVEEERNGRLGKLTDLSNTVNDLEKLTTGWHSIVDANLATQHLHVAVEAVRSSLENADMPKPFVKELAALKEIAADDPVVNAAIASINPTAYQRGIPTTAQLIDRFRRVAGEVRKASLLPEEAGVASHASSYVLSKLLFKKKGLAAGDDVESILTRTETLLEEGDLDGAAREMNGLSGWAKTLSQDWLAEVRKVLEVQQALDVIATEARLQSLRVE